MRQQLFDAAAYAHRGGGAVGPVLPAPGRLFDPGVYGVQSPTPGIRPAPAVVQPKMFMTPTEIHAGWQPLDADREDSYEGGTYEGTYSPKSWETGQTRPRGDQGSYDTREARRDRGVHSGPGGEDTGTIRRTWGGGKYRVYDRGGDHTESDEQLWSRKLEEAQEFTKHGQYEDADSDPLRKVHGATMGTYEGSPTIRPGSWQPSSSAWARHDERADSWENRRQEARYDHGESLYDSIAAEGVHGPIRLGSQEGSMGKPQIVGGHHRLAAATEAAPHRLVPVLHDWSIHSAREEAGRKGGYPYS